MSRENTFNSHNRSNHNSTNYNKRATALRGVTIAVQTTPPTLSFANSQSVVSFAIELEPLTEEHFKQKLSKSLQTN